MLVIHQRLPARSPRWDEELHLTYEARSKSRLRCFAASGEEVGLFLERGPPPLGRGGSRGAPDRGRGGGGGPAAPGGPRPRARP
ncbi:hypothetical protein ACRCQW_10005, partial [Pseudomonas aeruginosa]